MDIADSSRCNSDFGPNLLLLLGDSLSLASPHHPWRCQVEGYRRSSTVGRSVRALA